MHRGQGVRLRAVQSRTGESPGYWLARHMARRVRGEDHSGPPGREDAGPWSDGAPDSIPPSGRKLQEITQLHLLSYRYML
ncbi:hypothetical protein DKG34_11250 [Streptomyces sp. NWU49]|uniref:Transposase n=1 Tax=Streptomyces viridosporus T7A TaxID=665577 RepID=A0ABX6AD13_STRVD|nr:hypothetical protein DKG34_11250 [Streptomyces sp. NWU49]QEU84658.1 hypothetical protein CP969_08050 [Streptomyces viridosporus T7A]